MKLFHIGIRTTEIVSIHPSEKDNLPTVYRLKNGFSSFTTGDWRENVRLVEKALMQRGKVAPILIKDASTIDKKMLRAIADIAKEYGAQVFAEVIANKEEDGSYDRECSFIIEEGRNALQVVKA